MKSIADHTAEMPFTAHLAELRTRILRSLLGICCGTLIAYGWVEPLFALLTDPIRESFQHLELIGTGPTEAFLCKLRVAIGSGVVLSIPFTFYQFWLFIAPGLLPHERKHALPFVLLSSLSFLFGVGFCFKVVLPFAFRFFSDEFVSIGVSPAVRIGEYFEFVIKMVLVFGVVFELPLVSYFLARFGILTSKFLKKNFRYFILGIFVVAGILSPPDIISQMLLALPLLVIYGLCYGLTRYVEFNAGKKQREQGSGAVGSETSEFNETNQAP